MNKSQKDRLYNIFLIPLVVTVVGGIVLLLIQNVFSHNSDSSKQTTTKQDTSTKGRTEPNDLIVLSPDTSKRTFRNTEIAEITKDSHPIDSILALDYYSKAKALSSRINEILNSYKLEKNYKSAYYDSTTNLINIKGRKLEFWQDNDAIGAGTINNKDFKEFFIGDYPDRLILWFRNTKDTTDYPYPIIRAAFEFDKRNQSGTISSSIYIQPGSGTKTDIEPAKSNFNNSLVFWNKYLED